MKRLLLIFFVFLAVNLAIADELRLLRSNLISGLIPDIDDAYGVAFTDFNQDSYPDIYITCFRNLNRLLINNGGIIPFIDRTIYSGLGGNLMQRGKTNLEVGISVADYDNDGLPDLFLAGWGKTVRLFKNNGGVRFEDRTPQLGLHGIMDANHGVWFDVNNDGYLDLFVTDEHHANRLFVNQKDGTFKENFWTTDFIDTATSQGALASDFDLDGDLDLYVCNWFAPDYFLINNGQGIFSIQDFNLVTTKQIFNSNSALSADIDNDGDLDLLVATRDGFVFFFENRLQNGRLRFVLHKEMPFFNIGQYVYGIVAEDFNNDGWLDLFFTINGANRLYLNDGHGNFSANFDTDQRLTYSTGAAAADLDRDGDLDLLVGNKDEICQVYLNPINNRRFVELHLVGVKSNRDAIGARVQLWGIRKGKRVSLGLHEVTVQTGYLSSRQPAVFLGTGSFDTLAAQIRFPSGRKILIQELKPGQRYTVFEYPRVLSFLFLTYKRLLFHAQQPQSYLIAGLTLFLLGLLMFYLRLAMRRYHLSPFTIGIQLSVWFSVAVILFIAMHGRPIYWPLLTVNLFSFLSVLATVLYSEKQRNQRQKHQTFRRSLQELSQRMLHIHDEKSLFEQLVKVMHTNGSIEYAFALRANDKNSFFILPQKEKIALPSGVMTALHQNQLLIFDAPQSLLLPKRKLRANVLIPVRSGKQLLAVLCLLMPNPGQPVNKEDLQLLIQIANQTAIALENISYIERTAQLTRQVTEARLKEQYLKQLEATNKKLDEKNRELTRLFKELQQKETQLIHSEKMAALGQLVAGITHELNNPISFIYANSKALETLINQLKQLWRDLPPNVRSGYATRFEEILSDIRAIISDNLKGTQTIRELVLQLKNFSRVDQAEWKATHIVEGIESSLRLIKHQLGNRITIEKNYRADPEIFCNPAQLNQVFVNLLINAIQAIEDKGVISIETFEKDGYLNIVFKDSGKGIPPDVLPRIFDPFFTTKDVNQGTGLGLSICYSIIEKHHGKIEVQSAPGKGSVFTVRLPLKQKPGNAHEQSS